MISRIRGGFASLVEKTPGGLGSPGSNSASTRLHELAQFMSFLRLSVLPEGEAG